MLKRYLFLPVLLTLIFAPLVFATVTTSTETLAPQTYTYTAKQTQKSQYYTSGDASLGYFDTLTQWCTAVAAKGYKAMYTDYKYYTMSLYTLNGNTCHIYDSQNKVSQDFTAAQKSVSAYTCDKATDTLSGSTCTAYVCASEYSLSSDKTQCIKQVTNDSCESLKGQSVKVWLTSSTAPACYNGCAGSVSNIVYMQFANGSKESGGSGTFTYTGSTASCSEGQTDTSTKDNYDKKLEDDLAAALEDQRKLAEEKCGNYGYDYGTANGQEVYTCKVPDSKTTTTSTTTNPDGSISTTETTTTNTGATGTKCSISLTSADMSCTDGTSGTSSSSSKSTGKSSSTTTNPDGSTTTTDTTTEEGDDVAAPSGDAGDFDYKETKRDERTISDVFESHYEDLKSTQLYSAASGFFNVSLSGGSCSPWVIEVPYIQKTISLDLCSFLEMFFSAASAVVMAVASIYAYRIAME